MSFLETILLPRFSKIPDSVTFYKRIHEDTDIIGKKVKIYLKNYIPFTLTVSDCMVYEDVIIVILDDNQMLDSINSTIVEVDEVSKKLEIADFVEDSLVQMLRRDSKLLKRIPQVIQDRPSFKKKIELAQTTLKLKQVDSVARSTGMVNMPLPDEIIKNVHEYVGNKILPLGLPSARLRKTMRLPPPPPPPPPPPFPPPPPPRDSCTGSNCSISGGRRKRTRRFKK
jgi:hypothetical protein